jgi:hypothetical protein
MKGMQVFEAKRIEVLAHENAHLQRLLAEPARGEAILAEGAMENTISRAMLPSSPSKTPKYGRQKRRHRYRYSIFIG